MHYVAHIYPEDGHLVVELPDAPGCQTFGETLPDALAMAREALEGWLEAHLVDGQAPPRPREHSVAPAGRQLWPIMVRAGLAAAIQVRWARQDAGLTQVQLAKRAGVSQQQIAKLEHPDENPTIQTLVKVAHALGAALDIALVAHPQPVAARPPITGKKPKRRAT